MAAPRIPTTPPPPPPPEGVKLDFQEIIAYAQKQLQTTGEWERILLAATTLQDFRNQSTYAQQQLDQKLEKIRELDEEIERKKLQLEEAITAHRVDTERLAQSLGESRAAMIAKHNEDVAELDKQAQVRKDAILAEVSQAQARLEAVQKAAEEEQATLDKLQAATVAARRRIEEIIR